MQYSSGSLKRGVQKDEEPCPLSHVHAALDASQGVVGFLGFKCTFFSCVELLIHSHSHVLSSSYHCSALIIGITPSRRLMPHQIQPWNQHCPELMSLLIVVLATQFSSPSNSPDASTLTGVPGTPSPMFGGFQQCSVPTGVRHWGCCTHICGMDGRIIMPGLEKIVFNILDRIGVTQGIPDPTYTGCSVLVKFRFY